ncbi:hypothetical protein Y1Q_0009530 [Alligator mississippiensis]|uniref:Uncharacterized protein n=1 Tax=Alligator mississippiensis TaxID=8496 RepID=A0A151NUF5_ALLMI|nr:hypothetical protein Y1Q_0009530 [Alligator mississippiensis]
MEEAVGPKHTAGQKGIRLLNDWGRDRIKKGASGICSPQSQAALSFSRPGHFCTWGKARLLKTPPQHSSSFRE